jgi:UDP-2-acetamido-3-amino-2,3-dideoxy-glucuronate N-acetyltransferase
MGAGRWGINVVRVFADEPAAELVWVADPDPEARARVVRVSPDLQTCATVEQALGEVDAVAVCTPAADHYDHVEQLLAAGKHVLVEKPFATDSAAAERLVGAAAGAELTLMVGHQLLFHPVFRELERLVADGSLGELREIRARRTGRVDLEREPGVIWAYGPHDVAMILALVGEVPSAIAAKGRLDRPGGAALAAEIDLELPSAVKCRIGLRGDDPDRARRLTVVAAEGTAEFDDSLPGGQLSVGRAGDRGAPRIVVPPDRLRLTAPLAIECRHFVECVGQGSRPRTDGAHAAQVTEVLDRALAGLDLDASPAAPARTA